MNKRRGDEGLEGELEGKWRGTRGGWIMRGELKSP